MIWEIAGAIALPANFAGYQAGTIIARIMIVTVTGCADSEWQGYRQVQILPERYRSVDSSLSSLR